MVQDVAEIVDTLVIGGGQAGLSTGYALNQRNIDFVIVDASARVGDAWRNRWDSLRLFTPARMNGLPGMSFPGPGNRFVGKDQVADYLQDYAEKMRLPVRSGVRVERLSKEGNIFTAVTSAGRILASNVIIAMADYQVPKIPQFASQLDQDILQLHSTDYKNPEQLRNGPTLVVGLGNSGADIAFDLASTHKVIVAGKESSAIPLKLESWLGRHVGTRIVKFVMINVLNTSTPIGRKVRPKMLAKAAPLVRIRPKELADAGVGRVPRIKGVEDGKPVAANGQALDVRNVIWCTGFEPGFEWVDLPIFDDSGRPRHHRGISDDVAGLYFIGLNFLHAVWSETIPGAQPDIRYVVQHLAQRRDGVMAA